MRTLSVEDEKTTAAVMKVLLERKLEASVDIAPDCASARKFLASNSYDLITLDYQLPDGDGLSMLKEIVEMDGAPPVIMVTAHGDEATAVNSFKFGASGYVVKDARMSTMLIEEARSALARAGQKKAEEALREEQVFSERAINSLKDLFYVLSVEDNGRLVRWNKACNEETGYTDEELARMSIFDFLDAEGQEAQQEFLGELMTIGSAMTEGDVIRKGGKRVPYQSHATLTRDENGNPLYVIGMGRDITERKEWESKLRKANKELDGYSHTVSHDLKGPLASISMAHDLMAEIIKGKAPELMDETSEVMQICASSIGRATGLIDSLLALAETGEPTGACPVDLNEKVEEILFEKKLELDAKGIEMKVDDLGILVADPTHVYQVFSNLIRNAVRYTGSDNGLIEVKKLGENRYLVRDNGPGISEKIIDDIFVPFVKDKDGDKGLGLSIVKKIVETYGGQIRAYNDNGACFEFTLQDWPPEPPGSWRRR